MPKRTNIGELKMRESILDIAKPMESAIIQGASGRMPLLFKDPYTPLQFVHFSDIHSIRDHWDRILNFINHYKSYLSFGIHTGDYVSGTLEGWVDLYGYGIPCERPVLNCIGNHDRATDDHKGAKKVDVAARIFNHTEDWEVTFMEGEGSMTYYKDFPESGIRLIVLDNYYDVEAQILWLRELLARSLAEGVHVITAAHQPTAPLTEIPDTTFTTVMDWSAVLPQYRADAPIYPTAFDGPIGDFIDAGGHFVCHLCGHHHRDYFGYTARGVLNIAIEAASCWSNWNDTRRVFDTRSCDCFNVTSVDVNTGILRIARIGNNVDYYLRHKNVLCYDYINKKVIYND